MTSKQSKIVITGAAGLVGQNLIVELKRQGYGSLVAIDKHEYNLGILRRLHPDVQVVQADLAEPGDWADVFSGADCCVPTRPSPDDRRLGPELMRCPSCSSTAARRLPSSRCARRSVHGGSGPSVSSTCFPAASRYLTRQTGPRLPSYRTTAAPLGIRSLLRSRSVGGIAGTRPPLARQPSLRPFRGDSGRSVRVGRGGCDRCACARAPSSPGRSAARRRRRR